LSYNDAHAKLSLEHLSENEAIKRQADQTEKNKDVLFGEDGW